MFEWILEFVWCIFPFRLNRKAVKTCDAHYQEITLLPKNQNFTNEICSLPVMCPG